MPDTTFPKIPISATLSLISAIIAVVAASYSIILDPTIITKNVIARAFIAMLSVKIVYMLFFWVYFCAVYIACLLYEKYHPAKFSNEKLVSVNYQFTIWIWLPATMLIYYIHKINTVDSGINPESFAYISKWLSFPFGSAAGIFQIGVASFLLFFGAYLVTLGRVAIDGNWKTHIYSYDNQKLQTSFIYSKVRHPIYCGQNYMAIGTSLIFDTVFCLLLPLALILFNSMRANREEAELISMTKLNYADYKKSVPIYMWYPLF